MPKPYFPQEDKIARMLRVNHAGEYGAKVIYQGQIDFIKNPQHKKLILHMQQQELEHLEFFHEQLIQRKNAGYSVRPTILLPFWHVLGYCAGAMSAACATKWAMHLTESIEEVIVQHYEQQIEELTAYYPKEQHLLAKIKKFRNDEAEHIDIAADYSSKNIFSYMCYSFTRAICKAAIKLSKRF
jgi:ubiquinone biosynthesis monooxygenase Coq7